MPTWQTLEIITSHEQQQHHEDSFDRPQLSRLAHADFHYPQVDRFHYLVMVLGSVATDSLCVFGGLHPYSYRHRCCI